MDKSFMTADVSSLKC